MDIVVAPDPQAAANESAAWLARQLRNAVSRRGAATVAFSGGWTPRSMLAALADMPVPWKAITVYQVDERVAPDGDPDRNAGMLDVAPAVPRRNLKLMPVTATDLAAACRRYAAVLPDRFDVIHLGLGDDGHTASWPPGDPVVERHRPGGDVRDVQRPHPDDADAGGGQRGRWRIVAVSGAGKARGRARLDRRRPRPADRPTSAAPARWPAWTQPRGAVRL